MGPSGSGKSTLMHILAGLDTPTEGSVKIDGIEITTLSDNELTKLRRDHIGFVFQFFNLLPMLTAQENMPLPLSIAGREPDPEWMKTVIDETGLRDRLSHRPSELSGGQQQRVAVARALLVAADRAVRRRADRQPRLRRVRGGPAAAAARGRHRRADGRDGHPRRSRRRDRRSDPVPVDGRIVRDMPAASEDQIIEAMKTLGV